MTGAYSLPEVLRDVRLQLAGEEILNAAGMRGATGPGAGRGSRFALAMVIAVTLRAIKTNTASSLTIARVRGRMAFDALGNSGKENVRGNLGRFGLRVTGATCHGMMGRMAEPGTAEPDCRDNGRLDALGQGRLGPILLVDVALAAGGLAAEQDFLGIANGVEAQEGVRLVRGLTYSFAQLFLRVRNRSLAG